MKKSKLLSNLAQLSVVKKAAVAIIGSVIFFFLVIALIPRPFYKEGFRTLQEFQAYAQSTKEMEPMSNNNTLKPEFEQYYRKFKPSFTKKLKEKITFILSSIKLAKQPVWSTSFFKTLMETQAKEREGKGLTGNLICKITATENSKFVVFGNLQGAYHSFVRYLIKLKELGIINDKLEIIQPDHYVIFMGNVISRSCYSMETLAAVARFVQINPEKAVFLKGNHETSNYWQEHTLKTELQIRASHLSQANIPLEEEVNKYFNTLAMAAYISIPDAPTDFIRISHLGRSQSETLNENNYAQFLTETAPQPLSFKTIKDKGGNDDIDTPLAIKVIIRGEKKRDTFQNMEGLRLLASDMDSVAWNILSCPTFVFQKAIKFYHDAFVILSAHKNIDEWKLTLYSRDTRTQNPFKATTYFLLSGINTETNKQLEREAPAKKDKKKKTKIKSLSLPERSLPAAAVQQKATPQLVVQQPATTQQAPIATKLPQPVAQPIAPQQGPVATPVQQPSKTTEATNLTPTKPPKTDPTLEKIQNLLTDIKGTVEHLHRSTHESTTHKTVATESEPNPQEMAEQPSTNMPSSTEGNNESSQMIINQIGSGITEPKTIPTTSGTSTTGSPDAS